jgi:hypothetical protein
MIINLRSEINNSSGYCLFNFINSTTTSYFYYFALFSIIFIISPFDTNATESQRGWLYSWTLCCSLALYSILKLYICSYQSALIVAPLKQVVSIERTLFYISEENILISLMLVLLNSTMFRLRIKQTPVAVHKCVFCRKSCALSNSSYNIKT